MKNDNIYLKNAVEMISLLLQKEAKNIGHPSPMPENPSPDLRSGSKVIK